MGHEFLPNLIVMRMRYGVEVGAGEPVYYVKESGQVGLGGSVFNPFAKIAVEPSIYSPKYVHLRFCQSNRYWARRGMADDDRWIFASSTKPVEDQSSNTCTLFQPFVGDRNLVYFTHVQSEGRVRLDYRTELFYVDNSGNTPHWDSDFFIQDYDTIVKLPKFVTFKGDNDKYLKGIWWQNHPYLQFSGDDYNDRSVAYEVHLLDDGYFRIWSVLFRKFFRLSPNWIWADGDDAPTIDMNTLFSAVKYRDNNTFALRNVSNHLFCKRLTTENKVSCLNAGVDSITREAVLTVEELVLEREVYNVSYRKEDARVYDETPVVAGESIAINHSNHEASLTTKLSYVDKKTHSFNYSLSIAAGAKSTITAGIPLIVDGKIEVSAVVTNTFVWGRSTETSKTEETSYTVTVPARRSVKIKYLATQGKCDVPFSYTQKDKLSSDGSFVTTEHDDGISSGVNYFGFHFSHGAFQPL